MMFENILYATDFSESPFMLPCVGVVGKTRKIHLLHVVGEGARGDPAQFEHQMQEAKSFLEESLAGRGRGMEVDIHIMPGVPAHEICGVARRLNVSLIAVSYHRPGGGGDGATMDLIRNCDRSMLVMTPVSSNMVDKGSDAIDEYCVNLFRSVLCPIVGDPSLKLEAIRSLKEEARLGRIAFLCFSEDVSPMELMGEMKGVGLDSMAIKAEKSPLKEIIGAAEKVEASIIMVDARTEMGLALSLAGRSEVPMLILK
ncbi:universal stress protein [Methanocella conradii]|uniref:universal stress protein n=1 Tax=Methanocella conradii TaxID=1175444 RepID=UPI0024B331D8|nr:universal stress protein [Methanocella conradii]MDI6898128.1 universal stress protein [Methanocella conradii]